MRYFALAVAIMALCEPSLAASGIPYHRYISMPSVAAMKYLGEASPQYPAIIVDDIGAFRWHPASNLKTNSCCIFKAVGMPRGRWIKDRAILPLRLEELQ